MQESILEMQELIRQLNEASDAYYNGLPERMTDYEWDAKFDELRQQPDAEDASRIWRRPSAGSRKPFRKRDMW